MSSTVVRLFLFTLLQTCWPTIHAANAGEFATKLEKFIQNLVECKKVTGLAVAVVKWNETVYQGGFGYQTLEGKQRVTAKTLFNVGSNTKAFTSTLAADAVDRGKLQWDAPIRAVLGEDFRLQDKFRTEEASIRDLLSHKLGMPSYWGVTTAVMNFTREEIIKRFRYFPVKYGFRERFHYSNYPFVLAAATIEKATGELWEEAIYNRIYKPLGMTGARIADRMTDDDWSNTAWSYTWINNTYVKNPEITNIRTIIEIGPAGGVFINAEDMAKWIKFHINGGKDSNGNPLVSKASLLETYKPAMSSLSGRRLYKPTYPVDNFNPTYAMGWRNGIYRGRPNVYHTGSYSSYASRVTFFPTDGIGVWSAVSTDSSLFSQYDVNRFVSWFAIDLLLGKEPWLNETSSCNPSVWQRSRRRKRRSQINKRSTVDSPSSPQTGNGTQPNITEYLGDYFHPGFGKLVVFLDKNDNLKFKFGLLLHGLLRPTSTRDKFNQRLDFPLVFRLRPRGYDFVFIRNEKGVVVGTRVSYLESILPPEFYKSGYGPRSDASTPKTPACKDSSSVNSAPSNVIHMTTNAIFAIPIVYCVLVF